MTLQNLIQKFAQLRSGEIKVKNWLPAIVFAILLPTIIIIFLTFLGLFLSGASINYNGVTLLPSDPNYQFAYIITLTVLGVIGFSSMILLLLFVLIKPKPWVFWKVDYDHNIICYEITSRHERLIGPDYFIEYSKISNSIYQTRSVSEAKAQLHRTLFWTALLESKDSVKIQSKDRHFKITYQNKQNNLKSIITLRFDQSDMIKDYTETIMYQSIPGSSNIKSMNKYYLESLNQTNQMIIHPMIRKVMTQFDLY
jgi:hypothetical protein